MRVNKIHLGYRIYAMSIVAGSMKSIFVTSVFVDESGIHLAFTRLYARSVDGERAVDSTPRDAGKNISLIGALSLEGLIAPMTLPGSVDTTAFLAYVNEVLIPQLWQGAIVVLDNLRVPERCLHSCGD